MKLWFLPLEPSLRTPGLEVSPKHQQCLFLSGGNMGGLHFSSFLYFSNVPQYTNISFIMIKYII